MLVPHVCKQSLVEKHTSRGHGPQIFAFRVRNLWEGGEVDVNICYLPRVHTLCGYAPLPRGPTVGWIRIVPGLNFLKFPAPTEFLMEVWGLLYRAICKLPWICGVVMKPSNVDVHVAPGVSPLQAQSSNNRKAFLI